jgi:DNA primase catalytic core
MFSKQCQKNLFESDPDCKKALEYLVSERGLLEDYIRSSGVGFCRKRQKVPGEDTWNDEEKVGLENRNLKGRLVVPIKAEFGDIVGFAARAPDPEGGSWWNTKFEKYNHMYLFDLARKHMFDNDKVYIVEGYMDAMLLRQEGLLNVCGIMGTALGYRRIGLIKRYCDNICLCFDSDANEAGQRARDRSVYEISIFKFGRISIIDLPEGKDPDEFVIENGLDEFLELERDLTKKEIEQARERYLKHVNKA